MNIRHKVKCQTRGFLDLRVTDQVYLKRKQNDTWIKKADDLEQDVDEHETKREYQQYTKMSINIRHRRNTI